MDSGLLGSDVRHPEGSLRSGWTAQDNSVSSGVTGAGGVGQDQRVLASVRPLCLADCEDGVLLIPVYCYPAREESGELEFSK